MEKARQNPWARWQAMLTYTALAALVFMATVEVVNIKARNMVIYQPDLSSQQR